MRGRVRYKEREKTRREKEENFSGKERQGERKREELEFPQKKRDIEIFQFEKKNKH